MRKYIVTLILTALMTVGAVVGLTACNSSAAVDRTDVQKYTSAVSKRTYASVYSVGDVLKVVNVTDGSYRLKTGEYSLENGEVKISETYLKTLEENTEYTFRVVTASADEDFTVTTNFEAVTINAEKEGFTRGEDISFKVSGSVEVTKLEIDGTPYEFSYQGDVITLSSAALNNLTGGTHTAKAYTSLGRPTVSFNFAGLPDYREEEVPEVSHVFLWVDLAVFGVLIVGYLAFSFSKKFIKNKKG